MPVLVMKFGGTSVGDVTRIKAVADTIRSELKPNRKIIVVVSAMSDQTNKLIELAKDVGLEGTIDPENGLFLSKIKPSFEKLETNFLVSSGGVRKSSTPIQIFGRSFV